MSHAIQSAASETKPRDLAGDEHRYGADLRRAYPVVWWATLVGPIGASAIMLIAVWFSRGWEFMINLAISAGMIFFGLGRAVLLIGRDGKIDASLLPSWQRYLAGMTTAELAILIVWMDTLTAFLVVFHASFIYRIPKIGPAMLALQEDGEFFLSRHPWMRRFAWLGLIAFVVFPFAATGSVGGSIVGRLLGLSRQATLTGVFLGSIISTGIVFAFASAIKHNGLINMNSPWAIVASVAFVLAIFAFLNWRYSKVKKRWASDRAPNATTPAPKP